MSDQKIASPTVNAVLFPPSFLASLIFMPSPSSSLEQRVRELCVTISTTKGPEQDAAFAELEAALPALISEVGNISKYNLLNFPSAMEKRKKA